jgi:ATPase family AAA domain-containing protein 1
MRLKFPVVRRPTVKLVLLSLLVLHAVMVMGGSVPSPSDGILSSRDGKRFLFLIQRFIVPSASLHQGQYAVMGDGTTATSRLGFRLSPASDTERLKPKTATNNNHDSSSTANGQQHPLQPPLPPQQQHLLPLNTGQLFRPIQQLWTRLLAVLDQNETTRRWVASIGHIDGPLVSAYFITGLQYGLFLYLGYECFQAIREVLHELKSSDGSIFGDSSNNNEDRDRANLAGQFLGGGDTMLLSRRSAATQLVLWLHQEREQQQQQQQEQQSRLSPPQSVSPLALHLARQLEASGIPLVAPIRGATSVESILAKLTRRQAELLQSCLVVPNPSISLNRSVSGLAAAKHVLRHRILELRKSYARSLIQQEHKERDPTYNGEEEEDDSVVSPLDAFVHASSSSSSTHLRTFSTEDGRSLPQTQLHRPHPRQTQGMLLYGPPGCGKSLLIQAISSEARMPTLVITPSTIQRKWYGESNRQVRTLFQVLNIVRPCILVLDELDGLFRERHDEEHEAHRDVKTEFLQLWDGVRNNHPHHTNSAGGAEDDEDSTTPKVLLVIGATNRPFDVDSAVLRRLPQSFWIGLPTLDDRREMLWKWTKDYGLWPYLRDDGGGSSTTPSTNPSNSSHSTAKEGAFKPEEDPLLSPPASAISVLETLAQATTHYTPSDLWHAYQTACLMGPVARRDSQLTSADAMNALLYVGPTHLNPKYVQQLHQFGARSSPKLPQQQAAAAAGAARTSQHALAAADVWTRVPSSNGGGGGGVGGDDPGVWKWETGVGNFYHLGHVPMDATSMQDLLQVLEYLGSDYDEEYDGEDLDDFQEWSEDAEDNDDLDDEDEEEEEDS